MNPEPRPASEGPSGAHSARARPGRAGPPPPGPALRQYTRVARQSSVHVIRAYSTSFGLASRLLPRRCATDIATVYALVRIADEIVDGVAAQAGLGLAAQERALRDLQAQAEAALGSGFSTNPVVHAFAGTARRRGIGGELLVPFFDSMAMDLDPRALSVPEQERYVYGSAEVVGLMCLRVFCSDPDTRLEEAARALGSAFQNVNFLRDLAEDTARGRHYLPSPEAASPTGSEGPGTIEELAGAPETAAGSLDEATKSYWVARVERDLAVAEAGIARLPRDCRAGVRAAHALFSELNRRIASTPADELAQRRVRVPASRKARLVAGAVRRERAWRR